MDNKSPEEIDEELEKEYQRKRKKLKPILIGIAIFLVLLIMASVAMLIPLLKSIKDTYTHINIITRSDTYSRPDYPSGISEITGDEETFEDDESYPAETGDDPVIVEGIYYVKQKDPAIENILVIGSDSRDVKKMNGRSDSMIVVSYNKETGSVKLVSLLRDLLVPIEGYDWNRLNATFSFGGVSLCINTINQLFGLDIQKFVVINFTGASTFINNCGGVDISLTAEEVAHYKTKGYSFKVGVNHLSGEAALMHMRNRTVGYDFGRTNRQRDVMIALFKQVSSKKNLTEIYSLINSGLKLVSTNIKAAEIIDLATNVLSFGSKLENRI